MSCTDFSVAAMETLGMVFISTFFAYLVGGPIGVILNVSSKNGLKPCKWLNSLLGIIVNIFRSIPCLIIVVILIPVVRELLGKGTGRWWTMIIPLSVAAFGFVARMVEQSLAEVEKGKIEAVESLGATNLQIIFKVLIPEARASLISGLAVVLVSVLGYTSFAANTGSKGLIHGIMFIYDNDPESYYENPNFWILIIIVVVMVQIIQELGLFISRKLDKRRIK